MTINEYLSFLTETKIYDKDKWHKNSKHIGIMIDWLKKKGCLTKEGNEVFETDKGVIHDRMVNPKCKKILDKCYSTYTKKNGDMKAFEKCAKGL